MDEKHACLLQIRAFHHQFNFYGLTRTTLFCYLLIIAFTPFMLMYLKYLKLNCSTITKKNARQHPHRACQHLLNTERNATPPLMLPTLFVRDKRITILMCLCCTLLSSRIKTNVSDGKCPFASFPHVHRQCKCCWIIITVHSQAFRTTVMVSQRFELEGGSYAICPACIIGIVFRNSPFYLVYSLW